MLGRMRLSAQAATLGLLGLASIFPQSSRAADAHGALRLSTSAGADTNPARTFQGSGTQPDGFLSAVGSAQGEYVNPWTQFIGSYELGVRKFLSGSSNDLVAQSATGELLFPVAGPWSAGVEARAKDRRGGGQEYTDLVGSAFIELSLNRDLVVRIRGGGHRFIYRSYFPYSFKSTELGFRARYRINNRHSAFLFGEGGPRLFNATAEPSPTTEAPADPPARQDFVLVAGIGYRYRGPVSLIFSYSYGRFTSNSFGQTAFRHRVTATAGIRLPLHWSLLVDGTLQFTTFPDKVFSSPTVLLVDDENLNSLSLKLVHPLSAHWDFEVHAGAYHARLPGRPVSYEYLRAVAGIGVTWRL
jgi:hypothetical protein